MVVAGIDVGAATAKAVILVDGDVFWHVRQTGFNILNSSNEVMGAVLKKAGLAMDDIEFIISTGYARNNIPFADKSVTEIICHAKGACYTFPGVRTIIDIGGQDSKVIGVGEKGKVENFVMNDKCAAGTGRFLEVMATVLEIDITEMGPIALKSKDPCRISSTCTIFAESEMVSLRAEGRTREDLIGGIHKSMASRVAITGRSVGYREDVVFTGGVAKNIGAKWFLEQEIGLGIIIPKEPQIIGCLGAALLARAELGQ